MIQLLSPVGDFQTLAAAIKGGANAVYFGIKGLNMRAGSARNFTIQDIPQVVDQCHSNNVRCYITLNTVVYNHEMPRVKKILEMIKQHHVDAIIVTDWGVIQLANTMGIDCHISTQTSIANLHSALFYAQYASRLVLARECTLEQIQAIKQGLIAKGLSTEIEIFCHGALCVAESGRCFMSQFHNRISANRGQCLHECRREYRITDIEDDRREFVIDGQLVMSPKDLCALPILDKMVDAGIDVFKIEGRAKGPEYTYTVTKVYREALDAIANKTFTQQHITTWLEKLKSVYNRDFHTNFLLGTPTNDSWSTIAGNLATTTKQRIGVVTNYFSHKQVAEISLENVTVHCNDILGFTGPTTGYVESKATSMHTDDGPVQHATKTLVTVPVPERVRINDTVFRINKTTLNEYDQKIQSYEVHTPFKTPKQS